MSFWLEAWLQWIVKGADETSSPVKCMRVKGHRRYGISAYWGVEGTDSVEPKQKSFGIN